MPVKVINRVQIVKEQVRGQMVEGVNRAAKEHASVSRLGAPLKKGRLRKSIRVTRRATEKSPHAIVKAGGIVVDGVLVDYAEPVNYGHATADGGHVAGTFFWEEGMEAGREAMQSEAVEIARSGARSGHRTFVQTSLDDEETPG